jgi:hypothetical protein
MKDLLLFLSCQGLYWCWCHLTKEWLRWGKIGILSSPGGRAVTALLSGLIPGSLPLQEHLNIQSLSRYSNGCHKTSQLTFDIWITFDVTSCNWCDCTTVEADEPCLFTLVYFAVFSFSCYCFFWAVSSFQVWPVIFTK